MYASPSLNNSHSHSALSSAQKGGTRYTASADKSMPMFLPPRPRIEIDLTINIPSSSSKRDENSSTNASSKYGFSRQEYRKLQLIKAVRSISLKTFIELRENRKPGRATQLIGRSFCMLMNELGDREPLTFDDWEEVAQYLRDNSAHMPAEVLHVIQRVESGAYSFDHIREIRAFCGDELFAETVQARPTVSKEVRGLGQFVKDCIQYIYAIENARAPKALDASQLAKQSVAETKSDKSVRSTKGSKSPAPEREKTGREGVRRVLYNREITGSMGSGRGGGTSTSIGTPNQVRSKKTSVKRMRSPECSKPPESKVTKVVQLPSETEVGRMVATVSALKSKTPRRTRQARNARAEEIAAREGIDSMLKSANTSCDLSRSIAVADEGVEKPLFVQSFMELSSGASGGRNDKRMRNPKTPPKQKSYEKPTQARKAPPSQRISPTKRLIKFKQQEQQRAMSRREAPSGFDLEDDIFEGRASVRPSTSMCETEPKVRGRASMNAASFTALP